MSESTLSQTISEVARAAARDTLKVSDAHTLAHVRGRIDRSLEMPGIARRITLGIAALSNGELISGIPGFISDVSGVDRSVTQNAYLDLIEEDAITRVFGPQFPLAGITVNPHDPDAVEAAQANQFELANGNMVDRYDLGEIVHLKIAKDVAELGLAASIQSIHHQ